MLSCTLLFSNSSFSHAGEQLVPLQCLLMLLNEVTFKDVFREIRQPVFAGEVSEGGQQHGDRGHTLLAVDQLVDRDLTGHGIERCADEGPQEVNPLLRVVREAPQVVPQTLPVRKLPRVVPLKERDQELIAGVKNLPYRLGSRVHVDSPSGLRSLSARDDRRMGSPKFEGRTTRADPLAQT